MHPLRPTPSPFRRCPALPRRVGLVLLGWLASAGILTAQDTAPNQPESVVTSWDEYWNLPDRNAPGQARLDMIAHVAYFDPAWTLMWIHDGQRVGYILDDWHDLDLDLEPGGRYRITGTIQLPAAELSLRNATFTPLPDAPMPTVEPADFTDHRQVSEQILTISGLVINQSRTDPMHTQLTVAAQGKSFHALVIEQDDGAAVRWVGSFVTVSGVYNPKVSPSGEFVSLEVMVASPDFVHYISRLDDDPRFDGTPVSLNRIAQADSDQLVLVAGEVVDQVPGRSVTVRDHTAQATVLTGQIEPLAKGTAIEIIGHPRVNGLQLALHDAFFRHTLTAPPPAREGPEQVYTLAARVLGLSPDEANDRHRVELDGMITWSHADSRYLYFQDSSGGVGVYLGKSESPVPEVGARARLTGVTGLGEFAPVVVAEEFSNQAGGAIEFPVPANITLDAARTGVYEAQWVELTGYLFRTLSAANWTHLHISTHDGDFRAVLPRTAAFDNQVGAVVRLRGVCTAVTDDRGRVTNVRVWVPSENQVDIRQPVPTDPFSLPLVPLTDFGRFGTSDYFQRHVRIAATVLSATTDRIVLVQEGHSTLRLLRRDNTALQAGDRIEAVGLPTRIEEYFALREAQIRVVGSGAPPAAERLKSPRVLELDYVDRRVTIDGELLQVGQFAGQIHLTLENEGQVFEAQIETAGDLSETPNFQVGSRLLVTGIYAIQTNDLGDPAEFHLKVDHPDSVTVLSEPATFRLDWVLKATVLLAIGNIFAILVILRLRRRLRAARP